MKFAYSLKRHRLLAGMTRDQLASATNMSEEKLSRLESVMQKATTDDLSILSEVLKTRIDQLTESCDGTWFVTSSSDLRARNQ